MKKIISLLLVTTFILTFSLNAYAAFFSDMDDSHWAISYVQKLVSDGTVNGFEDGTFRPTGTVTRAQFVKMIGKGPETHDTAFEDVPPDHWAYEYIMTSGLDAAIGNMFMPSEPITRGDVVNLLWKRAGSPECAMAAPVVAFQGTNPTAVSWAYTNSIMTGDNNIELRLGDTLTRAEASALIVRSREINDSTKKTYFYDVVDPKVLEVAYNSFKVIDKEYNPDATITNGELAMAAARILSGDDIPDYPGVSAKKTFDHEYSQPLNMLCRYYLGEDKDNAEYIEKTATVKDAVMALAFVTLRTAHNPIRYYSKGASYPNVTAYGEASEKLLRCAYQNGVMINPDLSLIADRPITLKEFASLLLQFDGFSGFTSVSPIGISKFPVDYKFDTKFDQYPANSDDYRIILKGIPKKVYETPFVGAVKTPAETYSTTKAFDGLFNLMFEKWYYLCQYYDIHISVLANPVLSAATENAYTFRVKLTVLDKGFASVLSDIIDCSDETIGSTELYNGMELWLDINSGSPLDTLDIPVEGIFVNQIL